MPISRSLFVALGAVLALSACARRGEIDATGGILEVRSACPDVSIPTYTGDVTLFDPAGGTDARAIDVVATITNLKVSCNDQGGQIYSVASFDVEAVRRDAGAAREVVLPYFSTVVRGGTAVVAKRIGQVRLSFPAGQTRATAPATASAYVDRAAATLPPDVEKRITRDRKPGDEDAALDPLADPQVRAAIQRASFELLVGFNLTQDQLQYNVTR